MVPDMSLLTSCGISIAIFSVKLFLYEPFLWVREDGRRSNHFSKASQSCISISYPLKIPEVHLFQSYLESPQLLLDPPDEEAASSLPP